MAYRRMNTFTDYEKTSMLRILRMGNTLETVGHVFAIDPRNVKTMLEEYTGKPIHRVKQDLKKVSLIWLQKDLKRLMSTFKEDDFKDNLKLEPVNKLELILDLRKQYGIAGPNETIEDLKAFRNKYGYDDE